MLVISRRTGEEIVIGNNIRLRVAAIEGGKVRLAISAPSEITIDRLEVHQRRQEFTPEVGALPNPLLSSSTSRS